MPEPIRIQSTSEIDGWFEKSHTTPVLLFKHSLTCPISHAAFDEYQRFIAAGPPAPVELTLVEVQRARDVCNEIAARTGVRHESPQAILVHAGAVVWHASHWEIREASLRSAIAAVGAHR